MDALPAIQSRAGTSLKSNEHAIAPNNFQRTTKIAKIRDVKRKGLWVSPGVERKLNLIKGKNASGALKQPNGVKSKERVMKKQPATTNFCVQQQYLILLQAQQEAAEPRAQLANTEEPFRSEPGDLTQEWFSRSSLWKEACQLLQTLGDGTIFRELMMHCSKSPSYLSCATNSTSYLTYFYLGWVYCFRAKWQSL